MSGRGAVSGGAGDGEGELKDSREGDEPAIEENDDERDRVRGQRGVRRGGAARARPRADLAALAGD